MEALDALVDYYHTCRRLSVAYVLGTYFDVLRELEKRQEYLNNDVDFDGRGQEEEKMEFFKP